MNQKMYIHILHQGPCSTSSTAELSYSIHCGFSKMINSLDSQCTHTLHTSK
jgi:hypothetical protein